jgi:hypothetical protein
VAGRGQGTPPGRGSIVRMAPGSRLRCRVGAWRSLVARGLWVAEVPGSNPGAPIVEIHANPGEHGRKSPITRWSRAPLRPCSVAFAYLAAANRLHRCADSETSCRLHSTRARQRPSRPAPLANVSVRCRSDRRATKRWPALTRAGCGGNPYVPLAGEGAGERFCVARLRCSASCQHRPSLDGTGQV